MLSLFEQQLLPVPRIVRETNSSRKNLKKLAKNNEREAVFNFLWGLTVIYGCGLKVFIAVFLQIQICAVTNVFEIITSLFLWIFFLKILIWAYNFIANKITRSLNIFNYHL